MAHFAKLDKNNIVIDVIVVGNECITDENGVEQEELGIAFCKQLYGENTKWKQTSYNGNFRKRFAGLGMHYNEDHDVFTNVKPFASWVFDVNISLWVAPTPEPTIPPHMLYGSFPIKNFWNEKTKSWETKLFYDSEWKLYEEQIAFM